MTTHSDAYPYIRRIKPIWTQMELEITLSRQGLGSVCHLATALLLDEEVRGTLSPLPLPVGDELRFVLTDKEPSEEQFRRLGIRVSEHVTVLPGVPRSVGAEVYQCVREALAGNVAEGLEAKLRLLEYVLRDESVRQRLAKLMELPPLERALAERLP